METSQYINNLMPPKGQVDVILDTDAFNEIDDQYAIAYLLACGEKLNIKGFCAAPFYINGRSASPADGMERSYQEILKILKLVERTEFLDKVYRGSLTYLPNENTPVESDSADFMATLADCYSPQKPLYIVAIGAITNVASAILKNPQMVENTVIIWLGGRGLHMPRGVQEFNMQQDIAAARVVMGCGVPVVQLPCTGVVDHFITTGPELNYWLVDKNPLADYLARNTIQEAESYARGKPWSRVIWDVTAVAWLMNDDYRFMHGRLCPSPIPEYDGHYAIDPNRHFITYVYEIYRDALMEELFRRLGGMK